MTRSIATAALAAIIVLYGGPFATVAMPMADSRVAELSRAIMFGDRAESDTALDQLARRGDPDVVAAMLVAIRFRRNDARIQAALTALTGTTIRNWRDGMLWQEAHPEIVPHGSFRELKVEAFERIDPQFMRFLGGEKSKRENLDIRLEEITWGGVHVDGIPSLDNPKLIPAAAADYLRGDDLVFGVEINGDARAYPLRIMGWHEMFNDVIGGVPVALAYCTLCGAGILFETKLPSFDTPLVFGSSGFLYRSNKLMFDRQSDSLWNQFTGAPVSGPLRGSGIRLKIRPVVITSWTKWKADHADTKVLSLETGYRRNYGSGVVYRDYFASPDLMFPTIVRDESAVLRKDYVFGIRDVAVAKAWPLAAFAEEPVINDAVGARNIVLVGDASTRTVRAFNRREMTFRAGAVPGRLTGPDGAWSVTEEALIGPGGTRLARVPGHISYWFAWDGYLGVDSALYTPGPTR